MSHWVCWGCNPPCMIPADLTGAAGPTECSGQGSVIERERGHRRHFVLVVTT